MKDVALILSLCVLCSCRLGEPSELSFASRAGDGGADAPDNPMASGGGPPSGSGGAPSSMSGAGGMSGDGSSGAAGAGGAGGEVTAGSFGDASAANEDDGSVPEDASATSCTPDVLLCNPVTNEGCPPSMQCAVDLATDMLAGYCIFSSPPMPGCFNSGVTESCPPTQTCFDFACRTLCFCDGDCEAGQCCKEPLGELGFKVCGDC